MVFIQNLSVYSKRQNVNNVFLDYRLRPTLFCQEREESYNSKSATTTMPSGQVNLEEGEVEVKEGLLEERYVEESYPEGKLVITFVA